MRKEQIDMVQASFRQVLPIADTAAKHFYQRLFELDESLRALFTTDMVVQGNKLMQTLGLAVVSLHRLEQLQPTLRTLGARHVGYGVREEHYDTVESALLWALKRTLGETFTPELEEAWVEVYAIISTEMKTGATIVKEPPREIHMHV